MPTATAATRRPMRVWRLEMAMASIVALEHGDKRRKRRARGFCARRGILCIVIIWQHVVSAGVPARTAGAGRARAGGARKASKPSTEMLPYERDDAHRGAAKGSNLTSADRYAAAAATVRLSAAHGHRGGKAYHYGGVAHKHGSVRIAVAAVPLDAAVAVLGGGGDPDDAAW